MLVMELLSCHCYGGVWWEVSEKILLLYCHFSDAVLLMQLIYIFMKVSNVVHATCQNNIVVWFAHNTCFFNIFMGTCVWKGIAYTDCFPNLPNHIHSLYLSNKFSSQCLIFALVSKFEGQFSR